MTVVNVLPVLPVGDFDAAVAWYESVFGRAPDRRPMNGCAEWQLAQSGGVQVYRSDAGAGATTAIIGVDDVDALVGQLAGRGLTLEPFNVPSGQYRLALIQDPAGNTITFAQDLGATPA
jgi:predicted enzyme related to lactoylglutathione lyase